MAQKRSCEDQLPNEVSSKHPRQMEESDFDVSHVDTFSVKEASRKHDPSGEGSFMVNGLEGGGRCANGRSPGHPNVNEADNSAAAVPRSLSLFPWAASSTREVEYAIGLVGPLPFSRAEYFRFDRGVTSPLRAAPSPLRHDDLYSLLDNPPRKCVPIGPDHQADIPVLLERDYYHELGGKSVIPRNDLELPRYNRIAVGTGRTDCECADTGSVRCVRQHIMEARERLITKLGQESFLELGFCEMGEIVADKWSKDEQLLFDKVVHCNPSSLGKNFWNVLSAVFPSRTKMEIVSYYFNVFMLQKRAEQNRHDPPNVDSDNDEWQLSDDGFDPGDSDEEDSAVESPIFHDEDDSNNHIDYRLDGLSSHRDIGIDDHLIDEDRSHAFSELPAGNPNCGRVWQDFILEPCDAKTWDGYTTCPKDELDFLPTCSMIQEVFGDGTLDSDVNTR